MTDIATYSETEKISIAALCDKLSLPRSTFYRHQSQQDDTQSSLTSPSANALTNEMRQSLLDLLHCERFIDCTPYQVYYTLLDEGRYYASIRTFYRILAAEGETQERRHQRNHRDAVKPELMATAQNQVWSWDSVL